MHIYDIFEKTKAISAATGGDGFIEMQEKETTARNLISLMLKNVPLSVNLPMRNERHSYLL